jgi:hypothetical protein
VSGPLSWFKKLVNPADRSVSLRHVGYAAAVFGSLYWLSYELIKHGMTEVWIGAYFIFMGAMVTGKIVGAKQATAAAVANAGIEADAAAADPGDAPPRDPTGQLLTATAPVKE